MGASPSKSRLPKCPICGTPLASADPLAVETYPFCSPRCRLVDFNRWCTGEYKVVENLQPWEFPEDLLDQVEKQPPQGYPDQEY